MFAADDELFAFSSPSSASQNTSGSSSPKSVTPTTKEPSPSKQSYRTEFEEQYTFLAQRLGSKPELTTPQVRSNALRRLLHYSAKGDKAQLEKLAELFADWRRSGRTIDEKTTLEFIGTFFFFADLVTGFLP